MVAPAAGIGIGAAVWGSSGGTATVSASSTAPSTSTPSSPHHHRGVRGTITAESGSTWSVTTPAGEVVSVTLTAQTRFGTSAAPATQVRFVVGSPVTVIGQLDGSAITAKRVYTPLRPLGGGGTTTTLPPGAATGAAAAFNGGDLNGGILDGGVLDGGVGPAGDAVPAAWAAFQGPHRECSAPSRIGSVPSTSEEVNTGTPVRCPSAHELVLRQPSAHRTGGRLGHHPATRPRRQAAALRPGSRAHPFERARPPLARSPAGHRPVVTA